MMRLSLSVVLVALMAAMTSSSANAAVVTLLFVDTPHNGLISTVTDYTVDQAGTTVASAIGPVESGLTKYEVQAVQSRLVAIGPQTTATFISEPITIKYNIEQGTGNILRESMAPSISTLAGGGTSEVIGLDLECVLDDDRKKGVCNGNQMFAELTEVPSGTQTVLSTIIKTIGTTFTGDAISVATITTSGARKVGMPAKSVFAVMASAAFGAYITL